MPQELRFSDSGLLAAASGLTLGAAMGAADTTVTLSGTITPSVGQVRVQVQNEILLLTTPATSGSTYTCARAQEGTVAATHASGTAVKIVFTAAFLNAVMARKDAAQTWTALQTFQGGVINQGKYRFRAHATTVHTWAANPDKIPLDTVDYDPNSNWNASTQRYTAPVSGYYQLSAMVSLNCGVASMVESIYYINGVAQYYGDVGYTDAGQTAHGNVDDIFWLNATDYVELYAWNNAGTSGNTVVADPAHAPRMAITYRSS